MATLTNVISNATGNVGIGTTSTATKLQVYSTTGTAQIFNQLQLTNMGGGNNGDIVGIGFAAGESTQYGVKGSIGFVRTTSYGRGDITFYTNNTAGTEAVSTSNERMRITSAGTLQLNVLATYGSMTYEPSITYKQSGATGVGGIYFGNSYNSNNNVGLQLRVSNDATQIEALTINYLGNVGIGTTSPTRLLQVNGDSLIYANVAGAVNSNKLIFGSFANSSAAAVYAQTTSATAGDLIFAPMSAGALTEKMRIAADGNVGIGTTTLTGILTVYKAGAADRTIHFENGTTAAGVDAFIAKTLKLNLVSGGKNGSFDNGWRLNAGCGIGQATNNGYLAIEKLTAQDGSSSTEVARFDTAGNLGIGTTSPAAKLDVVGSAAISSTLTVTGTTALNGAVNLSTSGTPTVTLGASTTYGLLTATGTNAASIYLNGATRTGFEAKLQFGAAEHQWFNGSLSSQIMTLNTTGLGIGTSSPVNKLDVVSATANNGSPFAGCFFSGDDSSASWRCAVNLQHNANTTISTGSSVGLSFTPLSSTSSNFYGSAAIKAVRPNTTANNQDTDLAFWTRTGASNSTVDTEKLRITGTGNVGIGTTSPSQKLEVNGTVLATAFVGPLTGNITGTAASAGALNTNNDYTVASLTSNGFVYSGSGAGSTGAFYFNTSSHGIRRASGTNDVYCYTTSGTLYLGADGSSTTHIRVLSGGDVGIGVSPSYKLDVNGNIHATGFPTSSDVRFKKNITPLENSLEKIKKLQGVRYEWNEFINNTRDGYKLNVPIIGLIAQEVEKVVPEIVDLWKLSDECQDARSIDYPRLIPLLIEAIKEQQIIIENQNQKIENLIARMSALEAR